MLCLLLLCLLLLRLLLLRLLLLTAGRLRQHFTAGTLRQSRTWACSTSPLLVPWALHTHGNQKYGSSSSSSTTVSSRSSLKLDWC
jgi:hypothetical protein